MGNEFKSFEDAAAPSTLQLPLASSHLVHPLVGMRVFASLLLAASSVFAYQVTSPGNSQGWNNTGPNFLNWQRVDTDPPNFAVYLTNSVSPDLLIHRFAL